MKKDELNYVITQLIRDSVLDYAEVEKLAGNGLLNKQSLDSICKQRTGMNYQDYFLNKTGLLNNNVQEEQSAYKKLLNDFAKKWMNLLNRDKWLIYEQINIYKTMVWRTSTLLCRFHRQK